MKSHENEVLHLPVLIEQDEDDVYIVSCPIFKGCHSYGKSIDEGIPPTNHIFSSLRE